MKGPVTFGNSTKLNCTIEHTLLRPDAVKSDIRQLCEEALRHHFATVCILPTHVEYAAHILIGSPVKVCSVVGFPLGANTSDTKSFEASQLCALGAQEIDMVMNIGALKSREFHYVKDEIANVVKHSSASIVKVIIETCLLTDEEKVTACCLARDAGAHYVKTSTGFSKTGATIADVALMRKTVPGHMGVKASGGIRDYKTALAMIEAGADRLGTSAGVAIVSIQVQ
ncbi:MAG: deoxyribose-phosphate aldolase [Parachlamydiaceae bacterium]